MAVADITAGPTLMLDLACASPVAACRREPLREPPWVRWTGHAALEAPACLPLRWAAGAADLRHGWPKQAGRAAAGWQVRGGSPCGKGAWRGRGEAGLVLGGARAGQDAPFGYYAAPVSIVLPAVKLSAHAGMVGVPARAARALLHLSLGQLAARLRHSWRVGWRVGRRPAVAARR